MKLTSLALGLSAAISFTACKDSSSSAQKSEMVTTNFSITGSTQQEVTTPEVTLNEAWIVLKKIQFQTSDIESNSEDSYHYKGPFFVNLLSDEPTKLGEIELPATNLTRIKTLLHKDNNVQGDVPAALNGKSIYLSGTTPDGTFTYVADDTTDFDIKASGEVIPEEGTDLMAVIRLDEMLAKIDLSSITGDVQITSSNRVAANNPCPTIHAQASDLYTCFVKGLALEAKFGKDNGSNELLD